MAPGSPCFRALRRLTIVACVLALTVSSALAAKKPKKPSEPKPAKAADPMSSPLQPDKLAPEYARLPFGGTKKAVLDFERSRIQAEYQRRIVSTPDVRERDQLRAKADEVFEAFAQTYFEFNGRRSGYDVSVLSGEFRHSTGQSLLLHEEGKLRGYLLFSEGKLWKLVHQQPAEGSFDALVEKAKEAYGPPDSVEVRTVFEGEEPVEKPKTATWKRGGLTFVLTDESALYGTFIAKWAVTEVEDRIARQAPSGGTDVRKQFGTEDVLMDIMTPSEESVSDIVDQILEGEPKPKPKD